MRTALTHARDALGLIGAVTLILYIVVVPHRPEAGGPGEGLRSAAISEAELPSTGSQRMAAIPEATP